MTPSKKDNKRLKREDVMLGTTRTQFTRRTMLAVGAAAVATPALAENCHLGPPEHAKGPKVWMDMDQTELDAAYDQAFYAPLARLNLARRAANSELTRKRLGAPKRVAYGPTDAEKLDIFTTKKAGAPVFVFIHGGAWLGGAAKNYADCAELFVNAGANYVVLDFIAIKEAGGDLAVMADQVRRGIAWTYKNAKSFGGDPARLYIGGHSSGGHLCGVALVTDWQKDYGVPDDTVKGGL
jgi:arylformamidase